MLHSQLATRNSQRFRLGCVSYLNAKPLIFGLESDPDIDLVLDVPSRLLDGLLSSRFDVALLPTIDYQRMDNLALLPVGGIGSEDQTLTVCIFSKCPISEIRTLSCDPDSHTSVALARIILEESFKNHPEFVSSDNADARLLIGDKVIKIIESLNHRSIESFTKTTPTALPWGSSTNDSITQCSDDSIPPFHLDLGSAWKKLTGLPFLFACWTTRRGADLGDLPQRLLAARQRGLANIPAILQRDAVPRGWPLDIARQYLTENLCFDVGQRQLESVRLFHQLAAAHGIISVGRPLEIFGQ